ncbi:MAG: heme utilization cystosolic carrier protein HutX [Desulfovibrio sp.]|jgi:hypothetical protein
MNIDVLREKVQEKVRENPSVHARALADELGMSEADVVACFPETMRVEVPAKEFESLWKEMTTWEKVTFISCNEGAVVEVSGRLPKGRFGHGFFNLMERGNPLKGHLFVDRLGSIWLVSKPFFNMESYSVQFFDTQGQAMFSVYLGRDEKRRILGSVLERFLVLRGQYASEVAA